MIPPPGAPTEADVAFMSQALELARRGIGTTHPNPRVGCVVVSEGKIVGRGFHERAGLPHAEPLALAQAGELARGATLYVTLEPCSHFGRTPPCADAVIRAGLKRVVVGMVDPNPVVAGTGLLRLVNAGIEVVWGVLEAECIALNEPFLSHMLRARPWVTAKFGASLDGRIATRTGASRWITSEPSRRRVHELRATHDAIVVGVGTVLADDPELTVRLDDRPDAPNPHRYILDSRLRTPDHARVLDTSSAPTTLVCTGDAPAVRHHQLLAQGVDVVILPRSAPGAGVDPVSLLALLDARGQLGVFIEGGGSVLGAMLDAGLVDRLYAFIAPIIIGGTQAPSAVGGVGPALMDHVHRGHSARWEPVGPDMLAVLDLHSLRLSTGRGA